MRDETWLPASAFEEAGVCRQSRSNACFERTFSMAISPSRMSRATRCCVQIYAVLALAPLIVLLTVSGSAAADKQLHLAVLRREPLKDALGRPLTDALVILRAADGRTVASHRERRGRAIQIAGATAPGLTT